ncbi:hypothetical protein PBAL39_02885 [Pedobacter sp. BAL39]|nr:hypothetical protein PBAL39_02885 [Pedobacter sp. BAL39]
MTRLRLYYGLLIVLTIILGLLSRQMSFVPLATGDVLWAIMMFLIIRFLFVGSSLKFVAFVALLVCYLVELSQLYHAAWIDKIRANTLGALVLGRGFLWTDLIAYTIGVSLGLLIAYVLIPDKSG